MSEYQIEFVDVGVSFPAEAGSVNHVIDTMTLRIRQGEFVTIVGPSGCGKSTLLRMLFGIQQPTRGQVLYEGNPVTDITPGERVMVFQRYGLYENLTAIDNIVLGPMLQWNWRRTVVNLLNREYFRSRREIFDRGYEYMSRVGLDPKIVAKKYPAELSGGMQQRTAIARALLARPRVLLLDEPTSGLDVSTTQDLGLRLLEDWEEHHMTVIMVTHDLSQAVMLATRAIALSQHWSDDGGEHDSGARLVIDTSIPGEHPKPADWRGSEEFQAIFDEFQLKALEASHRQHFSTFNLSHRDAWNPDARGGMSLRKG